MTTYLGFYCLPAGAFGIGKRAFFEITAAGDRDVPNVSTAS